MDVLGETEKPSVPLVDTAELRDLPPVSSVEGVAQPELEPPPVPDSLTPLRVRIPRLGMDLAVFEGVSEKALRRGPGHLPGTPCPGLSSAEGNCVLTGHRDSFFRPLANAREGDLVVLRAGERSRRYRLTRKIVVRPEQTEVASPAGETRLTLLTCYPFRWIGPAPLRLAWQAEPEVTTAARLSR
jgi:sortase A